MAISPLAGVESEHKIRPTYFCKVNFTSGTPPLILRSPKPKQLKKLNDCWTGTKTENQMSLFWIDRIGSAITDPFSNKLETFEDAL